MKTQLKTIATAIALALATTTTPAMASGHDKGDPKGVFLGGGAAFAALDCPATAGSGLRCTSDSDTAPYIYLGYMANKHLGFELGYLHSAEFDLATTGNNPTTGTMEFNSLHFALIGRLPFNDNVAGFAKLGVASNDATLNLRGSGITASAFAFDTGAMLGAGLEVSSGNLAGRLEYSQVDSDIGYGGLSILYRFR